MMNKAIPGQGKSSVLMLIGDFKSSNVREEYNDFNA
jgi:hypothetical protein